MMSRIQITDGLGQRHRGVVAHSELATPDGVVDMGRAKLGIEPSQMRTGRVLHRGVRDVDRDPLIRRDDKHAGLVGRVARGRAD